MFNRGAGGAVLGRSDSDGFPSLENDVTVSERGDSSDVYSRLVDPYGHIMYPDMRAMT